MARGVAKSGPNSRPNKARLWLRNTGVLAGLPTPTWICSSKSMAFHQLIVIGLLAHTCVESTVRFAVELGYEVTLVKDATADYGEEFMHAALVTNLPNYAGAILTTKETVDLLSGDKALWGTR